MNTKEKLVNETLRFIAQKGWTNDEREFFDSLSLFLADKLQVAYVLINKLNPDGQTAETLSIVSGGDVKTNVSYALKNTPCENVMGKNLCCYVKNIQNLFPKDSMLVDMRAEGYIGIPLWSIKGDPLGLIALLDTKPIENPEQIKTILQIVAIRVAHEIERNNYEHELIDKTKKAEESENKFKAAFYTSPDSVIISTFNGEYVEINESFTRISGYAETEVIGKTSSEINIWAVPEDRNTFVETLRKNDYIENFESLFRTKNGTIVPALVSARIIMIKNEPFILSVTRDITERKKYETELINSKERAELSEKKYHELFTNMTNGFALHKVITNEKGEPVDYIISEINPAYEEMIGVKAEHVLNKRIKELFPAIDNEWIRKTGNVALTGVPDYHEIYSGINNRYFAISLTSSEKGYFNSFFNDITELKQNEIELVKAKEKAEESEEKYRLLSDLNHEGLAIHDKGLLLEANKAFYDIFGYSEKELSGKYAIDILFPEESIKIVLIKLKQPSVEPYVLEGIHKSGRHLWVEIQGRDFTFRGTPARFVLFRDITEKKKQEDIILESHKRFKRLTELTNEGILIHKNGIAVDVNPAFERFMGTSRDKLLGKNFISFLNNKKSQDIIQTEMKKDYASPYEVELRNEKDENITLQITSYFLSKEENLRVALVREITKEKEEEKKIMNAIIEAEEKERSYFSKELHDGLGPVLSSLNMYFEWLFDTDELKEKELILKNGMENINEAVNIVDEISNRLTPRTLNSFGINAAIETFISRLQIGDSLQFHFSSNLTERLTMHREAAIYRVITELINNSMKHASAKNITIDISYKKTDNYLIILYLDDGVGFNLKKALKKNEGFGLVNIMERVKTYNGNIKFTTAPGKGLKVEMNFYNAIQINEN